MAPDNQTAGQRDADKVRDQVPACVEVASDVRLRQRQEELDDFVETTEAH